MSRQRVFQMGGAAAAVVGGLLALGAGQGGRLMVPAAKTPTEELLAEVRALRAEVTEAAAASIRAQLLVARLELQEQRVNAVAGKLADVRAQLASVRRDEAVMQERMRASEQGQARLAPEDRSDAEMQALTVQLNQGRAHEQDLQSQESMLLSAASAERTRWSEFNSRLDALERSLPAAAAR